MTNTTINTTISATVAVPAPKLGKQNALVHGVYSADIVLPWESAEDFECLHQELATEWVPEGRTEQETVLALARLHWLKHRLMRSTQMAFRQDPFVAELEKSGAKTWAEVESFLQQKAAADDGVMDEARKTLVELKTALQNASSLMTASDPNTIKIYSDVELIKKLFLENVVPVYGKVFGKVHGKNFKNTDGNDLDDDLLITTVEKAYHPDYLEKIVRLEASIDARIDKNLHRLMSLKEYKRLINSTAASKQIASPSIAPPSIET